MENRRQDYRHSFAPPVRLPVALRSGRVHCQGAIVNLSIGGMAVELHEGPAEAPPGPWLAEFALPDQTRVSCQARLIHKQADGALSCGFQFLPLADSTAHEHRERLLWRFLLSEQRKQRKRAQA